MISELNDDEILEFLMTSDFEGDYKPGEFRYLLNKWRYFYRILHSRSSNSSSSLQFEIKKLNEEIVDLEKKIENLQIQNAEKQNIIDFSKNRRLTIKERISGKIITKNEDK
jgi:hypothetical protein